MAVTASVKSAIRVIEIFEFFESSREPRSLKEIISHLQYPQSSSTVLLKNLVSLGYLSYDCQVRKYFPTPRLGRLGDWVSESLFGEGRILSVMNEIHRLTGELVGVGIQNDVNLQYLKIIQPAHALPYFVPEGNMRLLTQSAGGWMLLAAQPLRKVDYTVRRANLTAECPEDRVQVDQFMERIAEIKRNGYAYSENVPFADSATLCVPLPITLKGQSAVLGIGGRTDQIRPRKKELADLLLRAMQLLITDSPIEELGKEVAMTNSTPNWRSDCTSPVRRNWFDALGQIEEDVAHH